MAARRPYGSASLFVRTDSAGRETWYGKWRANCTQVKRRIGPKRSDGARDGLTRAQAEAELRRLIAEVKPASAAIERLDLAEVGRRYRRHLEAAGRKPSTLAALDGHLTHWLVPYFGTKTLDAIRPEDIEDLMTMMRDGRRPGGLRRMKPLSPKTVRNVIGALSALYVYAMHPRRRWATTNPVKGVDLPPVSPDQDIRFLTPVEVEAVAAAAVPGPYQAIDRALFITAAMTGLRQGELIALRWRDVDWAAGRIRVRQNYVLGTFGTPKTKRSTRSVPMADRVAGELDQLAKAAHPQGIPDADTLVFGDPLPRVEGRRTLPAGGPLSKRSILLRYRAALKAAHLDDTHRFHDLRHTFGTRMAAAGMPMRTLQELMGHADIATTQRYADYAPSAREAAFIETAFGDAGTNPGTNLSESQMTSKS